ncbi:hypothetical protein [Pengzhenrongella sicca]|uniref:DUF4190 domain-containing protein n=1 Tax=Pengzhenrongella sicca TaxID=2819238 RepID=A0A8A4ZAR2_9MICO|nr:hypothetical protein [Pengzhenrongella sicca]QTE28109.1 hypothetical protein J4E96_11980 [Pengzhenrongella sicca]
MDEERRPPHRHDPFGERALAAGLVAIAASFVPVIGDVVAVAAAILAVALGIVGIRRYETGRATRFASAAAGIVLGAATTFVVALGLMATHLSP